jgi:hypothetical protein
MSFQARNMTLRLAAASLSAAAAFCLAAPANAAGTNYGPPPPPPNQPPPGGFNCILTSLTVGPQGALIGPLSDGALRITITIRRHTFPVPVQVTITEPYSRSGACQGVPIASELYGQFPRPLRLRITAFDAAGPEEVGVVGASGGLTVISWRRHAGPITVRVSTSEVLAVFAGSRRHRHHGNTTSRMRRDSATGETEQLTAALLPTGSWPPGLGVLATGDSGFLLSASHANAPLPR